MFQEVKDLKDSKLSCGISFMIDSAKQTSRHGIT